MTSADHSPAPVESDPVELLDAVPLTEAESEYVEAARAANTLRGYRSDWNEFTSWCTQRNCHRCRQRHQRSPATCLISRGPARKSAR